jgi:hypothetical protein
MSGRFGFAELAWMGSAGPSRDVSGVVAATRISAVVTFGPYLRIVRASMAKCCADLTLFAGPRRPWRLVSSWAGTMSAELTPLVRRRGGSRGVSRETSWTGIPHSPAVWVSYAA